MPRTLSVASGTRAVCVSTLHLGFNQVSGRYTFGIGLYVSHGSGSRPSHLTTAAPPRLQSTYVSNNLLPSRVQLLTSSNVVRPGPKVRSLCLRLI